MSKIGKLLCGVGVSLALIMSVGACMQVFGNEKVQPKNWFNKSEQTTPVVPDDENVESGGAIISGVAGNGINLASARIATASYEEYGISPQAESAYTLTATITPSSADDKRVEWTVAPKSGSLNAADYITLTSNGLQATVACKQAFDVQFIVTVKSVDNPEAKATCTLDYVERITGVTVNMPQLTSTTATVSCTTESSKYTIKAENKVALSNFQFNTNFDTAFRNNGKADWGEYMAAAVCIPLDYPTYKLLAYTYSGNTMTFNNGSKFGLPNDSVSIYLEGIIGCIYQLDGRAFDGAEGDIIGYFRTACGQAYLGTVDVTVSSTYGGTTYSSVNKTVEIWVDGTSLHISVSGVSLNSSSLVF